MAGRSRSPRRQGQDARQEQKQDADPFSLFDAPAPHFTEQEAIELGRCHFGIVATSAKSLGSERDLNFCLVAAGGGKHVLKIANSEEDPCETELQTLALQHVAATDRELPVPRVVPAKDGSAHVMVQKDGRRHMVRVLTWLDGMVVREPLTNSNPRLRRSLGEAQGRLARALRGFFHRAAGRVILWDPQNLDLLERLLGHMPAASAVASEKEPSVSSEERVSQIVSVMEHFKAEVKPRLPSLRAQVVQNDQNPDNVLVDPLHPETVVGVLDFGDVGHAPLICDVAVAATYTVVPADGPRSAVEAICDFLHGFCAAVPLLDEEVELLLDLVRARLVASVLITSWRASVHPENRDYIFLNTQFCWEALATLARVGRSEALHAFRRACGLASLGVAGAVAAPLGGDLPASEGCQGEEDEEAVLARMATQRARVLGPAYRLFYDRPAYITSASGVRLRDKFGGEYLDAYNNVPCVGHCHPAVVSAVTSQLRTLNTHTRYLHHGILQLSEELAATMPQRAGARDDGRLSVVMLVNSGSEAVDLALRLAEAYTGGRGVVVTEQAYHGCTTATSLVSPLYARLDADGKALPAPPHVRLVPAPDFYGGVYRLAAESADQADERGSEYADHVKRAAGSLEAAGMGPPTLLICPSFVSDGIFLPSAANRRLGDYLRKAVDHVRAAGGVFIADEVQSGYARIGSNFWSFEAHGVAPDIVTLGKPMGNGYPVAAVVTTPAIAGAFARQTRFFSTFAGGPVACAAALSVLEVIRRENIQARAQEVGAYGLRRFGELRGSHSLIGDVRGAGLFWGIELVRDRATREPAVDETSAAVNGLRSHGVLVSSTGTRQNVLKLRPPMQFSESDVDRVATVLDAVLRDVAAGKTFRSDVALPGTMTNV